MNFVCATGGHEAVPSVVSNQGFYFSRCRGCRCDMIRSRGAWQPVPNGFRVVWKPPRQASAHARIEWPIARLPSASPGSLITLLSSAARLLLWACADRFDAWRKSLKMPSRPRPAILRLPAP